MVMGAWKHGKYRAAYQARSGERSRNELRTSCDLQRTWIDNFLVDKVGAQKYRHFLKSTIGI